jgi:hypothetical protein
VPVPVRRARGGGVPDFLPELRQRPAQALEDGLGQEPDARDHLLLAVDDDRQFDHTNIRDQRSITV